MYGMKPVPMHNNMPIMQALLLCVSVGNIARAMSDTACRLCFRLMVRFDESPPANKHGRGSLRDFVIGESSRLLEGLAGCSGCCALFAAMAIPDACTGLEDIPGAHAMLDAVPSAQAEFAALACAHDAYDAIITPPTPTGGIDTSGARCHMKFAA